jgi:hypothetical protein
LKPPVELNLKKNSSSKNTTSGEWTAPGFNMVSWYIMVMVHMLASLSCFPVTSHAPLPFHPRLSFLLLRRAKISGESDIAARQGLLTEKGDNETCSSGIFPPVSRMKTCRLGKDFLGRKNSVQFPCNLKKVSVLVLPVATSTIAPGRGQINSKTHSSVKDVLARRRHVL